MGGGVSSDQRWEKVLVAVVEEKRERDQERDNVRESDKVGDSKTKCQRETTKID